MRDLTIFIRQIFASFSILAICFGLQTATAQQSRLDLTEEMVEVSNAFLQSLSASQREKASYDFDDDERLNWHFIPRPRNGLPLKEMNAQQVAAARALLQTFFSTEGFAKSEGIRGLESVLAAIEVNGRFVRDPDMYFITVFGTPGMESDWALRYEGHHQAFNWAFIGGEGIASSPHFFGTNPAEVREGPKTGTRVLASEEDMARSLIKSLNAEQTAMAILDEEVPNDIFTSAQKEVGPLADSGIAYSSLNRSQQEALMDIVATVAGSQPDLIAAKRLSDIRQQGLDAIRFAWIGSTERGDAHYYRIQGAGFLIEYDNTQNNANHVHLVWRDFDGDFGRDLIRMHYDAVAAEHGHGHDH